MPYMPIVRMPNFQQMQYLFQGRVSSFLSAGLVVLLCWTLAQWTWLVLTPRTKGMSAVTALPSVPAMADSIFAGHLFGRAAGSEAPQEVAATSSNLKLRGVFAAIGSLPAFAIVSVDGKPDQPVKAGRDIAPGLVLEAVYPGYVLVRRTGVAERLNLEEKGGAANSASSPTDFRLNVQSLAPGNFGFSRSELNQSLQDSKQLANLGRFSVRPGRAGLAIEEAPHGSLADKMGLQQGDVVLQVNGQPVNGSEDINRFYQQLNQVGQFRLDGLRGGVPLRLSYAVRQ